MHTCILPAGADDKPTALLRAWVRIDHSGQSSVVHTDKMTLSSDLGIQVCHASALPGFTLPSTAGHL